jgi:hypothetical protein
MKVKAPKKSIDFKTDSEVLCPLTIDWEPCAVAMRRGRFITSPYGYADGRREEEVIGYFISKNTAIFGKIPRDVEMNNELLAELDRRGVKIIELEHLDTKRLDHAGAFVSEICKFLVAPGLIVIPAFWKPSEHIHTVIKDADSPFKEHIQEILTHMEGMHKGVEEAETKFAYSPQIKVPEIA